MVNTQKIKNYLKKLGVAGFIFFLVKGLIWLFILLFLKSKL